MKLFNSIIISCLALFTISSCEEKVNLIDENNKFISLDSSNSANIKVIQVFAGNTPQIPTAPNATTGPQVFLYANGAKLIGNALSYGGVWPATNVYGNIPAGSTKFEVINARLNLNVVPNLPAPAAGDTLATFTTTLEAGKYYSFYIGDTVPTVRVTVKEDNLVLPAYQTYKIRVANFVMNPLDTLTLYSTREKAEIISDITHKNVSDWVQLPLPIISDTLIFRKKGTTAAYVQFNGFSPVGLRMYTFIGRGKNGVTGKTPSAAIITNR
ncbi:MAG: DUF4397 domain-containing protein [Ferruginibacter sp.]